MEAAEEEDAEDEELCADLGAEVEDLFGVDPNGTIKLGSTKRLGWNISYRSSQPESRPFSEVTQRWSRQRMRWAGYPLKAATEKASIEAQIQKQKEYSKRRMTRNA